MPSEWIKQFITGAEQLGGLPPTSIWAFFNLVLLAYVAFDLWQKKKVSEKSVEARIEQGVAFRTMASALEKMADEIKQLRFKVDQLGERNGDN